MLTGLDQVRRGLEHLDEVWPPRLQVLYQLLLLGLRLLLHLGDFLLSFWLLRLCAVILDQETQPAQLDIRQVHIDWW